MVVIPNDIFHEGHHVSLLKWHHVCENRAEGENGGWNPIYTPLDKLPKEIRGFIFQVVVLHRKEMYRKLYWRYYNFCLKHVQVGYSYPHVVLTFSSLGQNTRPPQLKERHLFWPSFIPCSAGCKTKTAWPRDLAVGNVVSPWQPRSRGEELEIRIHFSSLHTQGTPPPANRPHLTPAHSASEFISGESIDEYNVPMIKSPFKHRSLWGSF